MKSPEETILAKHYHGFRREKGVALPIVVLALTVLTLLALTMSFVSSTEVLVNQNQRMKLINLYSAESAAEEARDRLRELIASNQLSVSQSNSVVYIVSNSSINPILGDSQSNPYFDVEYSPSLNVSIVPSSLGSVHFGWVRIWQKTEVRAGYSLTKSSLTSIPIFYGLHRYLADAQLTQYVNTNTYQSSYSGTPVYQVTAFARSSSGYQHSVTSDIAAMPLPPLHATLFSKDPVQILGNAVEVKGEDQSASGSNNLNGVESAQTIDGNLAGVTATLPLLPDYPMAPYSYQMSTFLDLLKPPRSTRIEELASSVSEMPDGKYTGSGLSLGLPPSSGDQSQIIYVDGSLSISDSIGQGVLIVNGDLEINGDFEYYGLIVCAGRLHFNGSGPKGVQIFGAVISNSVTPAGPSILEGTVHILNHSDLIQKQFNVLPIVRIAYREI